MTSIGPLRRVARPLLGLIDEQLIDAVTGAHLWADRLDGSLEDVFDLQDRVALSVASIIEPALQAAVTARAVGRPTNDLTAYDLYLRAYAMVWSSARQTPEALRLMEQAIARDPRRKQLVWEIERKLAADGARPIISYDRRATCWQPRVKELTLMSIVSSMAWRLEDV